MPHYLVAIHLPDDYDPAGESDQTRRDIDVLNDEMVAAGIRRFVGGLQPPGKARTIRKRDGRLHVTDGPFVEAKDYVGGFWVLDVADEAEALDWGRKAVIACRAPVEVRPFY